MNTYDVRTPRGYADENWGKKQAAHRDQFVYTQGRANLLNTMLGERNIHIDDFRKAFPERPTTRDQYQNMLSWIREYSKAAQATGEALAPSTPASPQAKLPTGKRGYGYYAIPAGQLGYAKPHFFRVKDGKLGKQYLDEKAGPELYPVWGTRRTEIMKYLGEHHKEAGALYGQLIGNCRFCHRDLTDEDNPYKVLGAGPDCGPKYLG